MTSRLPSVRNRGTAYLVSVLLLFGIFPAIITPVSAGTLVLVKGSWDVIGLDHNNELTGPNQYLIQIHVTNSAGTTALSVSSTLAWTTANTYINLAPNESFTKSLGDIAPGTTVDLFYLIEVTRDSNAYNTTRDYTITIQGTNTGTADTITGQLLVERLRSQARNSVASMIASTTTPSVGDTFTITVNSLTGAKNYTVVNLPISEYNPTIIEPVSVSCTWVEPPAPPVTSDNVRLDLPGDDDFTSVWTFRAVAPGTSDATSFITDQSGGSFHYNADYPDSVTITVRGVADLRLEKTVNNPTPNVGDNVTFTVTVYNDGPNDAHNVAVEDILPAGLTYVSDTPSQGSYNNVTGIWTVGTITNGGSASLQITATVTASGSIKNVAQVYASDESDPDSTPNNDDGDQSEDDEDSETLTVPPAADLRMEKIVNNPAPNVGDTVTFTITVTNDGPDNATNVAVEDILPAGLTYVSDTPSQGSYNNVTGIWTVGTINNGATATLQITAQVTAAGAITNIAQVNASDQYDPDSTPDNDDPTEDDQDSSTINVPQADLRLEKSVNNPTPNIGDTVTFTITVYNDGPDNATNVAVEDILPAGLTYVSDTPSQGSYNNVTGIWTVGNLNNGASATLQITATVTGTGAITNIAQVNTSDQHDPDSTPDNDDPTEDDQDSSTVTVPQAADLRLEKTVNNPTPNVGDNVTFTITVYNDGPDNATNVAVEDILPAGLTYVSDTPSQGTYNNVTGIWTVGTINNGASATLQITATVTGTGAITNTAQVNTSDQYDPDSTPDNDDPTEDDQDSMTINVPQAADLRLEKTVNNPTPNVGDNIIFTITVYNDGPSTATNVAVEDILPAGLTYVSDTPSQGSYNNVTGIWTVGNLNNGATATLQITATVTASGAITNIAQVNASDQYDPDSTPDNDDPTEDDQDSSTVTAPQAADLRLEKTVNNPTPNVGDNITFTITVYNDGPDNATNVAVEDILPAGLTYVSDTPSQGSYNNVTGIWTVGTINNGATATLQITAQVTGIGAITNIAQVNASDQYDPDSTPDNDDPTEDDQDSSTISTSQADLRLEKTVNNPLPSLGDNIIFTITVYNDGPNNATNVAVEDILPAGLTYISDTPSQGSYNNVTGIWTVGTINNGATATLQITAQVTGVGNITNIAQVNASDQYDPDSTPDNDDPTEDDQDSAAITVRPAADLRLEKTVNNPTPNVSDNVTFTITVYNDGPDNATNVAVEDILPAGLTYVSDTPSQGSYNNVTGIWTVGTINNGATATLQITATVTASGSITNIAQVNASDQPDPDSTPDNDDPTEDDQDSSTVTVPQAADLRLEKTVNNPAPNVGDNVTFTITVYNDGPDNATNVAVEDILPAGLTYVSDTPSQGSYNNVTGIWTVGTINNGATATLQITATVTASGSITNIAQVNASDQPDPDSTPDNDDPTEDDQDSSTVTVPQAADLRLEKTVNNPAPNVGDNVTFTITVYNDGPDNATNVAVEDILPAGLTYVSDTPSQGSYNNVTGIWTVGTINNGATATLQITATVTASGSITNTAQVNASDQYDPDSTPDNDDPTEDDQDSMTINAPQSADLRLEKTVNNPTPIVGNNIIFTITVYNDGPNTATNVAVEDILPAGLAYVSHSQTQGSYNNVTGIWTVGTINNGASATLQITATVTGTGNITNIAQVNASDQYDPDSTPDNDDPTEDDQDSAAINARQEADLRLVKTVNNPTPNVGDTVTFTITVYNDGPNNATNVAVEDILPAGLTYVSDTPSQGSYNNVTGIWTVGTINSGATATLQITATVTSTGIYTNTAQVNASDQYDPDSTPDNDDPTEDDQDSATTTSGAAPTPAISIVKSVSPPVTIPGNLVTFTLVITNTGGLPLDPVEVVDTLSAGLTYAGQANIPPDLVVVNPDNTTTITWMNLGPLNPGQSVVLTYTAIFNGDESQSRNTAVARGTDPSENTVTDEASASVITSPSTPYQPNTSLKPLAYHKLVECYDEFRDLVDRIREANPDIEWRREVPCCEALEDLVSQLVDLVQQKGLDKVYPEKWARVQELLPMVQECCSKASEYYESGNYTASIYWSSKRYAAYRELIELLLEMLGY